MNHLNQDVRTLVDLYGRRHSMYALNRDVSVTEEDIKALAGELLTRVPSAYHSQSARIVLLFGGQHDALWDIVLDTLRPMVPPQAFPRTEAKVKSFQDAWGTILFFDDMAVTEQFEKDNPLYADNFKPWALQAVGMLQYAFWVALSAQGLGASLQHYNPLIDGAVRKKWDLPASWKLWAQMPFGNPTAPYEDKPWMKPEERMKVF